MSLWLPESIKTVVKRYIELDCRDLLLVPLWILGACVCACVANSLQLSSVHEVLIAAGTSTREDVNEKISQFPKIFCLMVEGSTSCRQAALKVASGITGLGKQGCCEGRGSLLDEFGRHDDSSNNEGSGRVFESLV